MQKSVVVSKMLFSFMCRTVNKSQMPAKGFKRLIMLILKNSNVVSDLVAR